MPTYRARITRGVTFQLDFEANSRSDALQKIMRTAFLCDGRDFKVTNIVSLREVKKPEEPERGS
jgi:hypothetical protein